MRSMDVDRKKPTPALTVSMSSQVSICGTETASTCKSGSAMVIAAPSRKLSAVTRDLVCVFVIRAPICVPMGVMLASVPRVNRPMPATSIAAATIKASIRPEGTGTAIRLSSATISARGRTEPAASLIFSGSIVFTLIIPPCANSMEI